MKLGLRQAAAALGISHVALLKAVKTGRVQRESDGTFDVEACRHQLGEKTHPGKSRSARTQQAKPVSIEIGETQATAAAEVEEGTDEDDEKLGYTAVLTARERVKLAKDKLDLAKRRGQLVEKDGVNAWVAGMILRAREILVQIGPELRDKLAKISDPVECERLLMAEVNRALKELAEYT